MITASRLRRRAAALALLTGLATLAGVGFSTAAFTGTTQNTGNSIAAATTFAPTFRVTTYQILGATFGGTVYTLTLDQALASDYFVLMRGGAGNNTGGGNRNPNANYPRVTGDPHSNFVVVTAANQIRLSRSSGTDSWKGQVTVVEGLGDAATSGFTLLDVVEVTMPALATSATGTSTPGWSDINQVGVYGGIRGGGVSTTAANRNDHRTAWIRAWPSAAATVNLERQDAGGGALSGSTTWTGYVVEWGSQWTIQSVTVSGVAGGPGADAAAEYVTTGISPVQRANTFVLAYGNTADNGIGDGWEGQAWTLGDGATQNATESQVAVGAEYGLATDGRTAEVYVHTHPDLAVDYRFGVDGTTGIPTGALTGTNTVDAALTTETYDNASPSVRKTVGRRFAIVANTQNGTGTAFPRPMTWIRQTAATTSTWTRSRSGQPGAFWLHSVDFGTISHPA